MKTPNENKALRLVQWLSDQAIDGIRPLSSAHDLADEYLLERRSLAITATGSHSIAASARLRGRVTY